MPRVGAAHAAFSSAAGAAQMKITAQTAGHVSQSRPAARLPLAERMIQELPTRVADPGREPAHSIAVMLFSFHRRPPFTALSCACAAAWACRHVAGVDCSLSPM